MSVEDKIAKEMAKDNIILREENKALKLVINLIEDRQMKHRKSREPSPYIILALLVIVFCVVITLKADAAITTADNNQAKIETAEEVMKNQYLISEITYCLVLLSNVNIPNQADRYTAKLEKFDDSYHELKIFHTGQAIGFLNGILFQMGISNPSNEQLKNLAQELYFIQCDISL